MPRTSVDAPFRCLPAAANPAKDTEPAPQELSTSASYNPGQGLPSSGLQPLRGHWGAAATHTLEGAPETRERKRKLARTNARAKLARDFWGLAARFRRPGLRSVVPARQPESNSFVCVEETR